MQDRIPDYHYFPKVRYTNFCQVKIFKDLSKIFYRSLQIFKDRWRSSKILWGFSLGLQQEWMLRVLCQYWKRLLLRMFRPRAKSCCGQNSLHWINDVFPLSLKITLTYFTTYKQVIEGYVLNGGRVALIKFESRRMRSGSGQSFSLSMSGPISILGITLRWGNLAISKHCNFPLETTKLLVTYML